MADPINHTFWYLSRAAGLSAYVMLCVNIALGLALSLPLLERFAVKWRVFDLHQFTGLLLVALLGLHVLALLGDRYIGFTLPQLLVPFLSSYRPLEMALGVLAFYLTLVVTFTFYIRQRIGQRVWRLIHHGSFGVFALSLLHGILSGTDTSTVWALVIYAGSALAIGWLTWWYFTTANGGERAAAVAGVAGRPRPQHSARG